MTPNADYGGRYRVLSLCDRTGIMVAPWVAAGHDATTIDLQDDPPIDVRDLPPDYGVGFDIVFAFPPCTDLANSGARWFPSKGLRRLIDALEIVETCRTICVNSGAPWMIENPVGQLATYWRKPDYTFDPCDYGDPYTKKTCLWTGGGFVLPWRSRIEPTDGSKMHRLPPSPIRADLRSATPAGFAQAVYEVNVGALALSPNDRSGAP